MSLERKKSPGNAGNMEDLFMATIAQLLCQALICKLSLQFLNPCPLLSAFVSISISPECTELGKWYITMDGKIWSQPDLGLKPITTFCVALGKTVSLISGFQRLC